MKVEILFPGAPAGPRQGAILRVDRPLSFWGGIDPVNGRLTEGPVDGRTTIAGSILCLMTPRGSSSSSAVLLELIRGGHAPAAILMARVDAILGLGAIVGRVMDWDAPVIARADAHDLTRLPQGRLARLSEDGALSLDLSAQQPER